ncbi:DUF5954 family protein [Streptomyces johnsoniae]|uniref:DUF5954 family protein n=1 Tax=Streptomyces johnsoniae TaxID=3075532 RepID=A0ABU2S7I1_9ACTN|nr:DUF5954 family protein [Streptomyces sp. DSM 41886]MDT0444936.1 DUF5954 family protein [Streptomyces sp. DSM 41886]
MSDDEEELPEPHRVIRMMRLDDPVAVIADSEAWRARDTYPDILPRGPMFAVTEQEADGRWRVLTADESGPQGSRDELGRTCRMRARAAADAGRGAVERAWMAAARRMDREKLDELHVADCRFRIARGDMFLRLGPEGPEPPRPSDPDPMPAGRGRQARSRTAGFLIDPTAATGMSEGLLKLDLLKYVYASAVIPVDVRADSVLALHTHPGGVLLPPVFSVFVRGTGAGWIARATGADTPQEARDGLARRFETLLPASLRRTRSGPPGLPEMPQQLKNVMAGQLGLLDPGVERLTDEQLAECARAATRLSGERLDRIVVLGRHFRITRLERLVRLGPDGPEPPRPSDWDPELPVEANAPPEGADDAARADEG